MATVAPGRRIPWTKPEDIAAGPDGPSIGSPEGIAALHPAREGRVALVVWADGSVRALPDSLDRKALAAFASRAGREPIDRGAFRVAGVAAVGGGLDVMKIVAADDGSLRFEAD